MSLRHPQQSISISVSPGPPAIGGPHLLTLGDLLYLNHTLGYLARLQIASCQLGFATHKLLHILKF